MPEALSPEISGGLKWPLTELGIKGEGHIWERKFGVGLAELLGLMSHPCEDGQKSSGAQQKLFFAQEAGSTCQQ